MAKSTTKKSLVDFDIEKIRRFTQTELTRLAQADTDLPFCYQLGVDVLVGNYKIEKIDDKCWRVLDHTQQIFDFFSRKDAIFYCIALHKKQLHLANDIKDADALLNKLNFEASLYRIRYKKAIEVRDSWGEDFYSIRYQDTMHRIEQVKKEIKISTLLIKHKYIKV